MTRPLPLLAVAIGSIVASGCKRGAEPERGGADSGHGGTVAVSAATASSATPTAPNAPANVRKLVLEEGDSRIEVSLVVAPVPASPVVIFLPKSWGSERELAPFAARIRETLPFVHTLVLPATPLTLTPAPAGAPAVLDDAHRDAAVARVRSIIKLVDESLGTPSPLYLVGSDFGATLAVLVAQQEPRVQAAALLSPGPALHGVDVYRPFAALLAKPVFLAACDRDPVSKEPMTALATMGKSHTTSKLYAGQCHGAGAIAEGSPVVRDDLAFWLEQTLEAPAPSPTASDSPASSKRAGSAPSNGNGAP
jgi:dienelactone hydrolase